MYDPQILAHNIKILRKRAGMTQGRLAELLYVTPQNISKWELGLSVPDIENLCRIANVFAVSVDTLLGFNRSERKKIMLAIDGGGTKTEFLMFDEDGALLGKHILGGSNPNSCGMTKSIEALKAGIDSMLKISTGLSAVYAGISGAASGSNGAVLLKSLSAAYPGIKFEVRSDIMNVIAAAGKFDSCIAVICGTGSVVYECSGRKLKRYGGWGYLFDESGSGYTIGRDALAAALAQNDGTAEKSVLLEIIEKRLCGNIWKKLDIAYSGGKDFIASFASAAFEACALGDRQARSVIDKNADGLARLINFASKGNSEPIIISGGIVQNNAIFRNALLERLEHAERVVFAQEPQIFGAAELCRSCFAPEMPRELIDTLKENYRKFKENENA